MSDPHSAPSKTPVSFEIKSANLPLVALLLRTHDLAELARALAERFGDVPDFFDTDPLLIDLSALPSHEQADTGADVDAETDTTIDFSALVSLLRQHRLAPIAFKNASPAQATAALAAGLTAAADAQVLQARTQPTVEEPAAEPVPSAAAVAPEAPGPLGALIVDKPLRSGQQVYARGRDLVVLSIVNAGAEVIADGSIHVYAPLRGKAIAGARGNTNARIFSLAMDAELLSIAGVYRTSDTPLPRHILGQPAQVRLVSAADGDKLLMEPLTR
jgi:septum site-determining protein MinC